MDRDWFTAAYRDHGRSLRELAVEAGCSPSTLARAAAEWGIPLRPRGGRARGAYVSGPGALSDLVFALSRETQGRELLRAFVVVAESRSFCEAARRLARRQSQISTQLGRLEREVGAALVSRSRGAKPLALTPLGVRLVRETRAIGVAPVPPQRVPQPLRSALLAFRAEERLSRLVVVAHSASLAEAAAQLRTDTSTLRRSLVAFEHALGYELSVTKGRHEQPRLTARGRRLVSQYSQALP